MGRWQAAAIGLAGAALTGCSPLGASPSAGGSGAGRSSAGASPLARAQATHEYPSPPSPPPRVAAPRPSAVQALRTFAGDYINWDARTVAAQMSRLARGSIGQARSAMQLAAAQTAGDYELQHGGIANRGTVEAVAPLPGATKRFVVVTRELTTASSNTAYQGLRPAWHVTLASVAELSPGRWAVSGWQPES